MEQSVGFGGITVGRAAVEGSFTGSASEKFLGLKVPDALVVKIIDQDSVFI